MKRIARLWLVGLAWLFAASVASASPIMFVADLLGISEAPPNASPGSGFAIVTIDPVAHTMVIHVDFTGLVAGVTASHIHCCTAVPGTGTAGVATITPTFTGFPGGVTSGTYDHVFDTSLASAWNPAFVTAHGGTFAQAEADFFAAMLAGKTYFNIHTTAFPGGEIRGFLRIPEPASLALLAIGLVGIGFARRRAVSRMCSGSS